MPDVRDDIAKAALAVAGHVHDRGYAGVVVSGASHQLSRSLLALAWGVRYPDERLKVFVLGDPINRMLYKQPAEHGEFAWWLHANLPELEALKGEPVCLVDDFAVGGGKYRDIGEALRNEGFSKLSFAFFGASRLAELGEDAFVGVQSDEAVTELHRLSLHIQDKPGMDEKLRDEMEERMRRYRPDALEELRDIGRRMK